jgi:hypothetical protein
MGGSIVTRMLADNNIRIQNAVTDVGHGGLAPFNPRRFARGIEKVCDRERENAV